MTFTANDASFTVDGIALSRSNNIVSDVINGVILNLKDKTTSPTTITVGNDNAVIENNIKLFINVYNDVRSYVNTKSTLDQKNPQNNGPFLGDSTVRGINDRPQQLVTGPIAGLIDNFNAINDVSITTTSDGKLSVDYTKLSTAIVENIDSISKIFVVTSSVRGLAGRIEAELGQFTSPMGGLIDIRMDGMQECMTDLNERITVMERRITSYESTLVRQFTALERLVGAMQFQGSSLGSLGSGGTQG